MKYRILLLILAFFSISECMLAQEATKKISGTVVSSEDNLPIIGASVLVVGTNIGAVTNIDGQFTLNAPTTAKKLRVSYVGMSTQEVPIKSLMKIILSPDNKMLQEVVVTGYGSARKLGTIAGSVTTVDSKSIEKKPVANIADALQGQVAGLQVFTSSGEPTAGVSMRIRGVGSLGASEEPLFILDGSPISSGAFTALNPNDIASMTVLKDASATAIYGSRAANGVVIMTTKKGKRGTKPIINVSALYGISTITGDNMKMMNSAEWLQLQEMIDPDMINNVAFQKDKRLILENGISTNWAKIFFDKSKPTFETTLNVTGGGDNVSYYMSGNYYDTKGLMDDSYMKRETLRARIDSDVNKWLKAGINVNLSYQSYNTTSFGDSPNNIYNKVYAARTYLPTQTVNKILTDEDGKFMGYGPRLDFFDKMSIYNPYYISELQPGSKNTIRLNANTYFEIRPVKGLKIRSQQAVEAWDHRTTLKAYPKGPFSAKENKGTPDGSRQESFQRKYEFTFTNTAEYMFDIHQLHHIVFLLGQEAIIAKNEAFKVKSLNIANENMILLGAGVKADLPTQSIVEKVFNSYFSTLNYNYNDKYYVDLSARIDGSSLFGANHRWAKFGSVGLMWNLKSEKWFQKFSKLNALQLKASYGVTGNAAIAPYQALGLVSSGPVYNNKTGVAVSQMENPNLTWEKVHTFNIGVSGKIYNVFDWSIEYYNRLTTDMLMSVPISMTTGFSSIASNVAKMRNKGIEVTLNGNIIQRKDLNLTATLNFSYNQNKIVELFNDQDEYILQNTGLKLQKGKPFGEYYYTRWYGVDPNDGYNIWLDKNGNKTKVFSDNDAVFTGKQEYAPWQGGFSTHLDYKGLYVDIHFSGIFGRSVINNEKFFVENALFATKYNQTKNMLNMWRKPGQITNIPTPESTVQFDTHLLEDASFVRMKNITIGYNIPQKFLSKTKIIRNAKVYFVGRNLLTFTKFEGYDPEVDSNITLGKYPNTKQYSFGLELSF